MKSELTDEFVKCFVQLPERVHNYSDVNLGCGKRVSTGITWVFEQVEEAIILEDDILTPFHIFSCYNSGN